MELDKVLNLSFSLLAGVFFCLYGVSSAYAQHNGKKPQGAARNASVFVTLSVQAQGSKSSDGLLREYLQLSQQNRFLKLEEKTDNLGFSQEKYQQYYKNIRVEYGQYKIHK